VLQDKVLPLVHQLLSQSFSLGQGDRKVFHFVKDMILDLTRETMNRCIVADLVQSLPPPLELLGRDACATEDADVGVDQEESKDLAMSRLGFIFKFKRLDPVLKDVWERQKSTLTGFDVPHLLRGWLVIFAAVYILQEFMVALLVGKLACGFGTAQLAKCERGASDILGGVVIKCCGDDLLVL
jgi:hypothetical protein